MDNKTLHCIIVDDQRFAIENLQEEIAKFPQIKIRATFLDPLAAMEYLLTQEDIDILFSDIDMPRLSGIQLAEKVRKYVRHLVFVTSHLKFELKPDNVGDWHYLHKPIRSRHLERIIDDIQSANKS